MTEQKRLVFLDLETMGLSPSSSVVEVGIVVAEPVVGARRMYPVVEWSYVVPHAPSVWAKADPVAAQMHALSGLTEHSIEKHRRLAVSRGQDDLDSLSSVLVAGQEAIAFLRRHGFESGQAIIAGNSVGMDRVWIATQMPHLHEYLHHRMVDVSALRTLARMFSSRPPAERPDKAHTAVADCCAALNELNDYLHLFA